MEEIIFTLLSCLDEDKKLNYEIVNTLKMYIMYHKSEILNYVFSFLQIQKVSHENQKLLLLLTYDFVHYCIYDNFSDVVNKYFEEEEDSDNIKVEEKDIEGREEGQYVDIKIFDNILKYTFFDGDKYCFVYDHELKNNSNSINEKDENKLYEYNNNVNSYNNYCDDYNKCRSNIKHSHSYVKRDANYYSKLRNKEDINDQSIFCYDKIINMKTLKKEEYKLFLIEKKNMTMNYFKKDKICETNLDSFDNIEDSSIKKNKRKSEINNIIKNIINFILKEMLYIKKNDERHKIMTNLLILCIIKEDNYLKKKIIEKVRYYKDIISSSNNNMNTTTDGNNNNGTKLNTYIYIDLYKEIFMKSPHLTKNVLGDIFKSMLTLDHNKHIDIMFEIFLKIFQDVQFPSVLYSIIYMNKKYKKKNFIITNKKNTNVYFENDVIQLSVENTSEDTFTTNTRESSLNSGMMNDMRYSVNNYADEKVYHSDDKSDHLIYKHVHDEKNKYDEMYTKTKENENIIYKSNIVDKKTCDISSEMVNGKDKLDVEKYIGSHVKNDENNKEKLKKKIDNVNKKEYIDNKESEKSVSLNIYEMEKEKINDIEKITKKYLDIYFNISMSMKYTNENYIKILYIISKLLLYINNEEYVKKTFEVYIYYFLIFFNSTIINSYNNYAMEIHDTSCIYNNDSQIDINYINLKNIPNYIIINSFRIILQSCLNKVHLIVVFTNNILKISYALLYILINKNINTSNCGNIIEVITSNDYIYTFIEIMEIFNILISCIYTNNSVIQFLKEKCKSNNKVDIIVSLIILKQYIVLISNDFSSDNIIYNISNQNMKINERNDKKKGSGKYKQSFRKLNSYIDTYQNNTNIELIIQMVHSLLEKYNTDLNIIYILLEISLLLSYHNYFNCFSYNPNAIFSLLQKDSSPLLVLYENVHIREGEKYGRNEATDNEVDYKKGDIIKDNVTNEHGNHSDSYPYGNSLNLDRKPKNMYEDIYKEKGFVKSDCSNIEIKKNDMINNDVYKKNEFYEDSRINMIYDEDEIKTWFLIPHKYVINIIYLFLNILLTDESNFKLKNKKYGYFVNEETKGTIYEDNNGLQEILKNGKKYNKLLYDIHSHYFMYMCPSVSYMKKLIVLAFQCNFSLYSPRVLYPLLFEYVVNIKNSYKIILLLLKCLNIICISLCNYMSKNNLKIHSRLHFNYLALPNINKIISVLFMYGLHPNFAVSFLSLQLLSILIYFTQNRSICSIIHNTLYYKTVLRVLFLHDKLRRMKNGAESKEGVAQNEEVMNNKRKNKKGEHTKGIFLESFKYTRQKKNDGGNK